jgi:hypothetical protein
MIKQRKKNDFILLIDQNKVLKKLSEYIIENKLFKNFDYYDSSKKKINMCTYLRIPFFNKYGLNKLLTNKFLSDIKNIYVFNDLAPETQYILNNICHKKCIYIEDGSAPYNNHYITHSFIKKNSLKFFFKFYECINVIGTSKHIDFGIYSRPSHIRNENKKKPTIQLKFDKTKQNYLTKNLYKNFYSCSKKVEVLIFAPQEIDTEQYIYKIKNLSFKYKICFDNIYIKQHPLSTKKIQTKNRLLHGYIPGEFYPFIYNEIKYVFGTRTTALQNLKIFFPHIKLFNVIIDKKNTYDIFLQEIGIENIQL